MQQMQADLMMRLNPDEMQNPMEEWMRMFQGADKSAIEKALQFLEELWQGRLPDWYIEGGEAELAGERAPA